VKRKKRTRGRKPGFKVSEETKEKMRVVAARNNAVRLAAEEEEMGPPFREVPSTPTKTPSFNYPRRGLLADLDRVGNLAQEMCGGIGVANIREWQAWVRAVVKEAKHAVRNA
jgi:hypothetical protein